MSNVSERTGPAKVRKDTPLPQKFTTLPLKRLATFDAQDHHKLPAVAGASGVGRKVQVPCRPSQIYGMIDLCTTSQKDFSIQAFD